MEKNVLHIPVYPGVSRWLLKISFGFPGGVETSRLLRWPDMPGSGLGQAGGVALIAENVSEA